MDVTPILPSQQLIKHFYDSYMKTVQCTECRMKCHEICLGKNKLKKGKVKCPQCEDKESQKQKCVVCLNEWGAKRKIHSSQKSYAHLPCLFFSNDFYCASFAQHHYLPLNNRLLNQIPTSQDAKCTICQNEVDLEESHLKCIDCDKVGHIFCGLHLESQCFQSFESPMECNFNSTNLPLLMYMENFHLMELINEPREHLQEENLNAIMNFYFKSREIQNKPLQDKLLSRTTFLREKKRQKVIFEVTCHDHSASRDRYCCHQKELHIKDSI